MNVRVVLPFHTGDVELALSLLGWIAELGGCPDAECLLVQDFNVDKRTSDRVIAAAAKAFGPLAISSTPETLRSEPWPVGANKMFETALKELRNAPGKPWLWLEPDCVPLVSDWFEKLQADYLACGKPYYGSFVKSSPGGVEGTFFSGIAVYPANAWRVFLPLLEADRSKAFDVAGSPRVLPMAYNSPLLHHFYGERNLPPTFKVNGTHPVNFKDLASIPKEAVLFHRCKDKSLIELLRKQAIKPSTVLKAIHAPPKQGQSSSFYHSGDLGDMIYSLLTVRELGGGTFHIGPDNRSNMSTRQKFTPELAANIIPLLEAQPYVTRAQFSEQMPDPTTYDLNAMRILLRSRRLDTAPGYNLARCYLETFGLALSNDNESNPWLVVPGKRSVMPVVVNRSHRYQNRKFRWDKALDKYRGNVVFVGMEDEYEAFCQEWGKVPFRPTANLLELAQVIAGAKLFIGNQSCSYAIAEALKIPAVLETCPNGSNTIFTRKTVVHGLTEGTVLPEIDGIASTRAPKRSKSISIRGPLDCYTGLGRITTQFACRMKSLGFKLTFTPVSVDERIPVPKDVLEPTTDTGPGLLITPLLDVGARLRLGDVLFTMWESTWIERELVAVINSRAAGLIVPNEWNASIFSASGVHTPICIAPLGVDREVFKPMPQTRQEGVRLKFGAAGRTGHGGKRKGIEDVIEAFRIAFPEEVPSDKNVRLSLKLFDDCYVPDTFKDDRIEVITGLLTDAEMAKWYASLDCFVCASKGEGWGLHVHEAMMCGRAVIAPAFGGLGSLVNPQTASCVEFDLDNASNGYKGHWAQVRVIDLAEKMAHIESFKGADIGRKHAVKLDLDNMTENLIEALIEIGALQ